MKLSKNLFLLLLVHNRRRPYDLYMFKLRPVSAGHSICVILFAACSRGKAGAEFHLNILIKYWKNVSHLTCFHPQYIYCMYYSVVPRFCWGRGGGGGLNLLPNFTTSRVYSHLTCFHPQSNYCMCYPIVPPSSYPPLLKVCLHRSLLIVPILYDFKFVNSFLRNKITVEKVSSMGRER